MYTNVVILEGINLQFEKRSQQFQSRFRHLLKPDDAFGFLVTALPTNNNIRLDHVYHDTNIVPSLNEKWHDVFEIQNTDKKTKLNTILDNYSLPWKPRPRAARADSNESFSNKYADTNLHKEIDSDGLVELGLLSSCFYSNHPHYVSPDLLIVVFANLIAQTHRMRLHAIQPTTPYTIKASMCVAKSPKAIGQPGAEYGGPLGIVEPGITTFPLYVLNDVDDATNLLNLFRLDLYHMFGRPLSTERSYLEIEYWPLDVSTEHNQE